MSDDSDRATAERYFRAFERWDLETAASLKLADWRAPFVERPDT